MRLLERMKAILWTKKIVRKVIFLIWKNLILENRYLNSEIREEKHKKDVGRRRERVQIDRDEH